MHGDGERLVGVVLGCSRDYDVGMSRLRRWRWWGKWGATLLVVVIVPLWVSSAWRRHVLFMPTGNQALLVIIQYGAVELLHYNAGVPGRPGWESESLEHCSFFWWKFARVGDSFGWDIVFPLWIPIAILAACGAFLWWRDRPRFPAGRCARCGYDLSGVATGPCPECGAERAAS
jgi:hypothetical protein